MNYQIPRIMLAAPASGGGKTMITCGLLRALQDRGWSLSAFKCGPDYIDPMFHKYVLGVNGGNLDSFFLGEQEIRRQLVDGAGLPGRGAAAAGRQSLAVIEGVMGYFDGVAGVSTWASSYEIAVMTETPVILIVDCKGTSLSAAAVIQGFLQYERDRSADGGQPQTPKEASAGQIRGVLLNRVSEAMADRLKPEIERLGVAVVGCIPEREEFKLESRHLGLVKPEEMHKLHGQLEALAKQLAATVDLDQICRMAGAAPDIAVEDINIEEPGRGEEDSPPLRIGIARDSAFCFYYQENLRLLESMGAKLADFSPLKDRSLPPDLDGMILGGGYPELYGAELASNHSMRNAVKTVIAMGMPYLAECGGFLYLHRELEGSDGVCYPMAGVIEAKGYGAGRLSRFGYISLTPDGKDSCLEHEIKGHEFHYWESTDCGKDWTASKPLSARGWNCVHSRDYQIAGFPHLYYPSNPAFVRAWLDGCRRYRDIRRGGTVHGNDGMEM